MVGVISEAFQGVHGEEMGKSYPRMGGHLRGGVLLRKSNEEEDHNTKAEDTAENITRTSKFTTETRREETSLAFGNHT